jgi:D-xylose transport system permease protein
MTDFSLRTTQDAQVGPITRFLRATEIDTRLLGMFGALLLIWIGFHLYPGLRDFVLALFGGEASWSDAFSMLWPPTLWGKGAFLTPQNLWFLTVQSASIGIMATGMVLVIITRNIDLSVGAILGVTAMMMGLFQVEWLPQYLGLGHPMIWVLTMILGIAIGGAIGAFQGSLIAYRGIPSFIVTLGGLLIWRGAAFLSANGRTISPVDSTFQLLGGGPYGAVGEVGSYIVGAIAIVAILYLIASGRRSRKQHDFPLRPMWAEVTMALLGCGLVVAAVLVVNAYPWPKGILKQQSLPEDAFVSHGFAIPVLMMVGVAIAMTILMNRTRFGRYVFAIGGNPEAAALSGINVKWMTLKIFALMGALAGLSAVIASARLNSATNALGLLDELYVIAAAVIGGTSLAGGVGTIYGAILGAYVMQSLKSGMVLIGFDSAVQQIVVGSVLVIAVYLDNVYRRRAK